MNNLFDKWKNGWIVFAKYIAFSFVLQILLIPISIFITVPVSFIEPGKDIVAGSHNLDIGIVTDGNSIGLLILIITIAIIPLAFHYAAKITGFFQTEVKPAKINASPENKAKADEIMRQLTLEKKQPRITSGD